VLEEFAMREGKLGVVEITQVPTSQSGIISSGDGGHHGSGRGGFRDEGVSEVAD
jgi:hypothetical protein